MQNAAFSVVSQAASAHFVDSLFSPELPFFSYEVHVCFDLSSTQVCFAF